MSLTSPGRTHQSKPKAAAILIFDDQRAATLSWDDRLLACDIGVVKLVNVARDVR
jgi:hypothetical protein